MRVRLGILITGVLLGLLGKLGVESWGRADKQPPSSNRQVQVVDVEKSADEKTEGEAGGESVLVPPAIIGTQAVTPRPLLHAALDGRALFEPHGEQVCASGCAVSRHPTEELSDASFEDLIQQYANEPMGEESQALETLLFFGPQSLQRLEQHGCGVLDQQRFDFLRQELQRTHARIAIRVVDESGVVRTWLPSTRVPLDRRHVFTMDVQNVQPLVTSGTVKRVGLYHLWTRL